MRVECEECGGVVNIDVPDWIECSEEYIIRFCIFCGAEDEIVIEEDIEIIN